MKNQRPQWTQGKDQEARFGWVVYEDRRGGYGLSDYPACPGPQQAAPVDTTLSLHEALILLTLVSGPSARLLAVLPQRSSQVWNTSCLGEHLLLLLSTLLQ